MYQLSKGDKDFGKEALETVMAVMDGEDNHSNNMPSVISAGYKTEVNQFMGTNSELRRRINHHFSPRLFATTVCGFIE